ncbi:toxin YdaT domain-containing protein [Klebsiella aerogenes]|uniref:toxin YdaT domain-containing protein n=1 Tax=Klebsiella aerogenes TaxID=548 RepID=UPI0021D0D7C4|nr:toxin YdaT domain-containing protein [Klebsiella aerogenes]MCU6317472.1 toxin YdaT domain-containing protein [Klebsiella aerogenes]HCM6144866.1 toxin YdaT domain-containing protein [Klebsiella aerogenes]
MQSLTYQNNTGFVPVAMINRAQTKQDLDHELIRDAVRAWASTIDNQDVVSALIINEYREQGGDSISFPDDISRARQKLFRFLDNRFDSDQYRENVRQLTPAIMAVLPLEFRTKLAPQNDTMSLIASAMKECAEAKQAVLLNAPEHQKLKEVSEGIASLFRLMPEQVGPLMTMVTSMLGVM